MRASEFVFAEWQNTALDTAKSWELIVFNCFFCIVHLLELDKCVVVVFEHWSLN